MMEPLINLDTIRGAAAWEAREDAFWMTAPDLDVVGMAQQMLQSEARLMTMTGAASADGETDIYYHYALDKQSYHICVPTRGKKIASITPVTPAASWIEREINDLYVVEFEGHPGLARLLRPQQLAAGFFRR